MSNPARIATVGASLAIAAYVSRDVAQTIYDRVHPARAHVRRTQAEMGGDTVRTHQNLMSLIRLRGQHRAGGGGAGPQATDIIVHGTSAAGNNLEPPDWAKSDSTFAQAVRGGRNAVSTSFVWSGSGAEADRQTAGRQLSAFIRDTQRTSIAGGRSTNVLAHSHGGNVLGHAMSHAGTHIDQAMLLATPAMSRVGDPNVSWTAAGTDRVRGGIHTYSTTHDTVQTDMAQANEWARGNLGIRSGRDFSRPGSSTPQTNVTVDHPPGLMRQGLAFARDAAAFGAAFLGMGGRRGGAAMLGGGAVLADAARGTEAHSDMHSDRMGAALSQRLQHVETVRGRISQTLQRHINRYRGTTAARREQLRV